RRARGRGPVPARLGRSGGRQRGRVRLRATGIAARLSLTKLRADFGTFSWSRQPRPSLPPCGGKVPEGRMRGRAVGTAWRQALTLPAGFGLDRSHAGIGKAEMVADLVNENVGDDGTQRLLVLGPVVEDGTAIEPDLVRQLAGRLGHAVLRPT